MMSRVIWGSALLVAVVTVMTWMRLLPQGQRWPERAASAPPTVASHPAVQEHTAEPNVASATPGHPPAEAVMSAAIEQPEVMGLQLDARGHLVKDAQTRDELERILSGDPESIAAQRQQVLDTLPAAAAQEALELLERFSNYRAALRQAMPAVSQSRAAEDLHVMLETMHALRVTYFGAQLTQALFGAEEALAAGSMKESLRVGSDDR